MVLNVSGEFLFQKNIANQGKDASFLVLQALQIFTLAFRI